MNGRRRILLITAHPDDADVHAGGAISRWADEGHEIHSAILTRGDKGHDDPGMTPERVGVLRETEQRAAAAILGVARLTFFDYADGDLAWTGPRLAADLTRLIRTERPDMVVTHDPHASGYREFQLHPDHRALGVAAVDAVLFRAPSPMHRAGHAAEGIAPHRTPELLLMMGDHADYTVDISSTFERKVRAVRAHHSQFGRRTDLEDFLRRWAERVGQPAGVPLGEAFKRLGAR